MYYKPNKINKISKVNEINKTNKIITQVKGMKLNVRLSFICKIKY